MIHLIATGVSRMGFHHFSNAVHGHGASGGGIVLLIIAIIVIAALAGSGNDKPTS